MKFDAKGKGSLQVLNGVFFPEPIISPGSVPFIIPHNFQTKRVISTMFALGIKCNYTRLIVSLLR